MDPFDPPLDTARHLRYWQRCIRTLLPHHYTSMDSTRLSLGFFILSSIDLLTPNATEKPLLTPADRLALRHWVLSTQHPQGGFCGSPTHVLPPHHQTTANANLAATYFALLLLAILANDSDANTAFAGVDRNQTLRWLRRLQRSEDGSFGEVVYDPPPTTPSQPNPEPIVAGGRDMRYCYLAAAIRWMLRDPEHDTDDIDVPALIAHIRRGQTYDGGFAESWRHESHAGYAYCAVAALALLDRPLEGQTQITESKAVQQGIADREQFISFLVSRSFAYTSSPSTEDDDDDEDDDPATANFHLADLSLSDNQQDAEFIGFNGRCNKVADTCYTWWTLGALSILSNPHAPDTQTLRAQRKFLLEKTQHLIGGFGKHAGSPPDVGHGCLGLAALATMGDPGVKRLDPALCVSRETVGKVEQARRGLLKGERSEKAVDLGGRLVGVAVKLGGGSRPEWLDALA